MNRKLFRSIAFFLLLTFSSYQLSFAFPVESLNSVAYQKEPAFSELPHAISGVRSTPYDYQSGAIASIITSPLQFIANTSYYIGQGDFKGLLKYWGSELIQLAIQRRKYPFQKYGVRSTEGVPYSVSS